MARPTSQFSKAAGVSSSGIRLPIKVWDLPTRLFHWLLVLAMVVSYLSVTFADGPNAGTLMKLHLLSGELALGLLIFRLIWGVIGSETARFANFLRSPAAGVAQLRAMRAKSPDEQVGHNAAGGWMVVIMLLILAAQIGTGLFSNDDGGSKGPLAHFVSKDLSDYLSDLHSLNFNLLITAVAVHVLAIFAYRKFKGHSLTPAMITGKKRLPAATPAPRLAHPLLAAVAALVALGVVAVLARLG